ncbi:centromere protein L [Austrofundulus limnaeus]|uniref:Centromere protein L n=1 Tax=Austrofundulus limnaeus TaxID=52670 RepID=A0A2I4BNN3_AUSLI|nr:PREDICTED: centromere protein L [Austrofundulus limnaeus]
MERTEESLTSRTPLHSVVGQRRSKNRSYHQSYRSCLGVASRLGLTPAVTARRLNTNRKASKPHNIAEKVNPEYLALLVKTEWQLSYVTPLYQFRHTQLKSYARQLSAFIVAERQQGLAVEVGTLQNSFKVSLSVVEGMSEADDDPETVLIQIHSKSLFPRQDEPQKLVWSGWLTCINGSPEYLNSLPKDFTCLPLFCYKGAENLSSLVKSWFQRIFDCCFGPLEINHTSLQWLVALWTNCHTEATIKHLKMLWTVPSTPPLQVTYTVEAQDAWELWSSVRRASRGRGDEAGWIDMGEVTSFMQAIKSHFYRHFKLDLSAGALTQVSTALGSAKFSGRIKISSSRCVSTTLNLLTECALLKMPI